MFEGNLIYLLISLLATIAGSLTGIGGGVIIKPVMDLAGEYNVETIGALSAITVLSMALVSVGRHALARTEIPFSAAIPLAIGSVAGGLAGQWLLDGIVRLSGSGRRVTLIQNAVLIFLILAVLLYMMNKRKIPGRALRGAAVSLLAGLFLGLCSSFLGIGGGPINVALIIYLYSFDTKTATVCSLVILLFSQISKLATVAATSGFGGLDLSAAPSMVAGAVAGGFIGAMLNKRRGERTVEIAFNGVQAVVLAISAANIVRNIS